MAIRKAVCKEMLLLYDPEFPGILGRNLQPLYVTEHLTRYWDNYGCNDVVLYYDNFVVGGWSKCMTAASCFVQSSFLCSILLAVRRNDGTPLGFVAVCETFVTEISSLMVHRDYINKRNRAWLNCCCAKQTI